MTNKVALIGAGVMGSAIGTRLLETGNQLSVFDPNKAKVDALADKGAVATENSAQASMDADYIILSLNSPEIVRQAVFGTYGIAEDARPGTLIIDMSSIDPDATKKLAAEAEQQQLRWVDSPLSGGVPKALTGELTLMAGGKEQDVTDAYEILQHVCANYTYMGPSGSGQTTKLINQVLCGLNFMAVAEATQLVLDAGVDVLKIPQALMGGRADSAILQEYLPRFATKDYRRTGRIDNMVKDLNGAQNLAQKTGTSMPLTAVCAEIHRMLASAGLGGEDQAALMAYFRGPGRKMIQWSHIMLCFKQR